MPRSFVRAGLGIALILALAPGLWGEPGHEDTLEYPVKAAFLYQLARFTEWPNSGHDPDALCIGLLGADPFGPAIDRALEGKTVGHRPLAVRRSSQLEELQACAILFVSRSETARLDDILAHAARRSMLTVGESEDFTRAGGMVRFFVDGRRVRFEINRSVVEAAALRINARVLAIAELTGAERRAR